jgi:hypothetical protein
MRYTSSSSRPPKWSHICLQGASRRTEKNIFTWCNKPTLFPPTFFFSARYVIYQYRTRQHTPEVSFWLAGGVGGGGFVRWARNRLLCYTCIRTTTTLVRIDMIFPPDPVVSFLTGTRVSFYFIFSCWPFLVGLLLSKKMIWGTAGEADRVYTVDENVFFFSSSSIFLSRLFSYSHPSAELWTLCWPHLVAGLWRVGRLICVYKESSSFTELIQLPLHTVVYYRRESRRCRIDKWGGPIDGGRALSFDSPPPTSYIAYINV